MTAQVASNADDRIRVWCDDPDCERPLDTSVATLTHGQNLAAKHDREHHAVASPVLEVNLTAAAKAVLEAVALGYDDGAMVVWCALTGTDMVTSEPLKLANRLAFSPTPVTAAVPPF